MDKQKVTAVVLLDMSKAFDSLNHDILLLKLQDIGLSSAALNLTGFLAICPIDFKLCV